MNATIAQDPSLDENVLIGDWDTLFGAVKARLRQAVVDTLPHELNGATVPLQASVLECVEALDQLHAMLRVALAPVALDPVVLSPWRAERGTDRGDQSPRHAVTARAADRAATARP